MKTRNMLIRLLSAIILIGGLNYAYADDNEKGERKERHERREGRENHSFF